MSGQSSSGESAAPLAISAADCSGPRRVRPLQSSVRWASLVSAQVMLKTCRVWLVLSATAGRRGPGWGCCCPRGRRRR